MNWLPKEQFPKQSGWYQTCSLEDSHHVIPRYFDNSDNTWWIANDNGSDVDEHLSQNTSFTLWCKMARHPDAALSLEAS
jgi:hypothetical protein